MFRKNCHMKEGYTIVGQKIDWERYLGTQWVFKELRNSCTNTHQRL